MLNGGCAKPPFYTRYIMSQLVLLLLLLPPILLLNNKKNIKIKKDKTESRTILHFSQSMFFEWGRGWVGEKMNRYIQKYCTLASIFSPSLLFFFSQSERQLQNKKNKNKCVREC